MRGSRAWLVLGGAAVLVVLYAARSDDDVAPPIQQPVQVVVSARAASVPTSLPRPARSPAPAQRAASAASPDIKPLTCDPAAADVKPSDADSAEAVRALNVALAARGSERAEAVRHYLMAASADLTVPAERERAGIPCDEPSCEREIHAAVLDSFDALARIAVRTLDPAIYAIAYQACRKRERGCQMISARQWAHLDPNNAAPWFHVAAEAAAERNESGVAEAMYQVARAGRSDGYEGVFVREVVAALPKSLTPAQHGSIATHVLGVEAAWVSPGMHLSSRYCSGVATRDANRRQLCADVADLLFRRSNTVLEQTTGIGIGRRSGWSAEKVEAAQAERDALMQVLKAKVGTPAAETTTCEGQVMAIHALKLLADRGEARGAREALRQSGKSVAEWASEFRAERRRAAQKEGSS